MWQILGLLLITRFVPLFAEPDVIEGFILPKKDWRYFDMEFIMHIDDGKSMCFFHELQQTDTFDVTFEVVDGTEFIDGAIWDPLGNIVRQEKDADEAELEVKNVTVPGVYKMCMTNNQHKWGSAVIDVYFRAYGHHVHNKGNRENWSQEDVVEETVDKLDDHLRDVHQYLVRARQHGSADLFLQEGNKNRVQKISLFSCCCMMGTAALQVYFVRRLFRDSARLVKTGA